MLYDIIVEGLHALRDDDNDILGKINKATRNVWVRYTSKNLGTVRPSFLGLLDTFNLCKTNNRGSINYWLKRDKNSLNRALIVSIYVVSQHPQNLPGAFQFVEELKNKYNDNKDTIEFQDVDCEWIFPILGVFIGAKKQDEVKLCEEGQQSPVVLNNNELADLAGVNTDDKQSFLENLNKFLEGIKPMEKKSFLGRGFNKKGVAALAIILGFFYCCYELVPFHKFFSFAISTT